MKCSESWLREWVNPNLTREQLATTLTMAGLEVEEMVPVAKRFTGIVVGQVMSIKPHPEAERLTLCEVDVGNSLLLIVCGAKNVRKGIKIPVAMIGAQLSNQTITQTTLRGISSMGMLCSASELGLAEESEGLLELPSAATLGADIRNYLKLDDYIIDISITPNRGDCLSIRGLAREIAALTEVPLQSIPLTSSEIMIKDIYPIDIEAKTKNPRYLGRIIRDVKTDIATPIWLKERLRRSGIRSINPIVDVTNYVMLELGQPMHAFDLDTLKQGIRVRDSVPGEKIKLLDGSDKILDGETLIIADHEKPLAIAGVMGGLDSSVTLLTCNIFLESAYFSPKTIARQRQHYNLASDSAYRFERGVDPFIQREALERATQLIIEMVGGKAGPVVEAVEKAALPKSVNITLSKEKMTMLLGMSIADKVVESIFKRLQWNTQTAQANWQIEIPSYRFDMALPEDVIEEIARLHGYDKIPVQAMVAQLNMDHALDNASDLSVFRLALSNQGFHEVISYSFVDKKLQQLLDPEVAPRELLNPITAEMAVMRTTLWPGLVNALLYNKSRQQQRIRLFEIGTCFIGEAQVARLSGLVTGLVAPEQWGMPARAVDFFDLKENLENVLNLISPIRELIFSPDHHPALHPGQTASIYAKGQRIGIVGAVHPGVLQALDFTSKVFLFELHLSEFQSVLQKGLKGRVQEISKFPEIRRDLAILIDETIPSKEIQDTIRKIAGDWLKDVFIFDVYQGKGTAPGQKSVALALILQHQMRTLLDSEVAELMERVVVSLNGQLGATLRS